MQSIYRIIKKIVLSMCLLYSFNILIMKTGIIIPINYYTIGFISLFGIPGLIGIILLIKII